MSRQGFAAAAESLQSCPTLRPHRRQPTRLLHPRDFPGKCTGVGCLRQLLKYLFVAFLFSPSQSGNQYIEVLDQLIKFSVLPCSPRMEVVRGRR